jgi:hypothetical protein
MVRFDTRDGLGCSPDRANLPAASRHNRLFCSLGFVTEPITGYGFASRLCFEQSDEVEHCPRLCGVGVRQKRLVGIKQLHVYALGLYVSENYAPEDTQPWDEELVKATDVDKIISCIISSSIVSRKKFVNALDDALLPAVKSTTSEATLGEFRTLFDNVAFRKGLHVDFYLRGGSLTAKVDDKELGSLHDPAFCRAFLDMYLGANPVSPKAKDAFRRGLQAFVSEKQSAIGAK